MSDPVNEYGWMMVGQTDYKDGDEHFDSLVSNKWEPCTVPKYCNCGYAFRRRRIVAPEGWRVMGVDEIPNGYCQAFGTDGKWGDSTWTENKLTIRQLIAGAYSQMTAVATPIKPEVRPILIGGYEYVDSDTLIERGWRCGSKIYFKGWFDCDIEIGKRTSLFPDIWFCRPIAKPEPCHWGDQVRKVGGDYTFEGTVVSVFAKLSGKVRYVVEDDRGCLHIYSEKNLEAHGK